MTMVDWLPAGYSFQVIHYAKPVPWYHRVDTFAAPKMVTWACFIRPHTRCATCDQTLSEPPYCQGGAEDPLTAIAEAQAQLKLWMTRADSTSAAGDK
jgi:hypothetical protein